jgi:hypothetical protein
MSYSKRNRQKNNSTLYSTQFDASLLEKAMPTKTQVVDLADATELAIVIEEICAEMEAAGYKLAATFTIHTQLVLIFQDI